MPNTTVIAALLQYSHLENHKIVSLISSTFREVFTRRRYLASMTLLVYSYDQLQETREHEHERLLQNVQHLQVLLTHKSAKLSESATKEEMASALGQFAIVAICQVAKHARLTSISVARYAAFVQSDFSNQATQHSDRFCAQLMAIPAENLGGLLFLNIVPLEVLHEAFEILLVRAPRIETLEFREYTSQWMDPYEDSLWSASCAPLTASHLVTIRDRCPRLRRLLGVHVDKNSLAVLETFDNSEIKLTDVYLVHDNVPEHRFRNFLRSQTTLVNVHLENIKRYWVPPPVSLFEVANSTLVNAEKLDIFGLSPAEYALQDDVLGRVDLRKVSGLRKICIDSWMQYDLCDSSNLQRVKFRGTEPRSWMLNMPWTLMRKLHRLSVFQVAITDHIVDLLRTTCPLLNHLKFKDCCFDSDRCFVVLSRMLQLEKLNIADCRVGESSRLPTLFSMPQLRRLALYVDFSDPRQGKALEFIAASPNLVRLKLYDFSPYCYSNAEATNSLWHSSLKQLRWLTTNVYKRRDSRATLDLSGFPLLERLCVIVRDFKSATTSLPIEISGTEKKSVFLNDNNLDPIIILLV